MNRRSFFTRSLLSAAALSLAGPSAFAREGAKAKRTWFEIRKYKLKAGGAATLRAYLGQALIPALNRLGITPVGVFSEKENPETVLYTLAPLPGLKTLEALSDRIWADEAFIAAGRSFHSLTTEQAPIVRCQTHLIYGIEGAPGLRLPAKTDTYFELRTYDGPNEEAVHRKIGMFNKEELTLFRKLDLDPILFGRTLAGADTPHLIYLLSYPDEAAREARWKTFIDHPEWAAMKDKPEYAHTVSKVNRTNLVRLPEGQW